MEELELMTPKQILLAKNLMDAAKEYWTVARENGVEGSVIWLKDDEGRVVIFTRGEYGSQLIETVNDLNSKPFSF